MKPIDILVGWSIVTLVLTAMLLAAGCGGGGGGDAYPVIQSKPSCAVALSKVDGAEPSCIPKEFQ